MRRALASLLAPLVVIVAGCTRFPPDPLQLDHGVLTVDNRTGQDWNGVEIWVNQYYRVTVPTIAAKSRFTVPLNAFVSGYGQRFEIAHATIKDLRLTAKEPGGAPVLVKKDGRSGLGLLGRKQ